MSALRLAFVNPFTSPEEFSLGLKRNGIASIGIFQRHYLQQAHLKDRINLTLFDQVICIEPDETLTTTLEKIKACGVDYIFNGFDTSVLLTDQLAHHYRPLAANPLATSLCRFDKAAGQDALRQAGFALPRYQEIAGDVLTAEDEHAISQWRFPLILKPTNSSGTTGFFECENVLAVKANLQKRISSHHVTGSVIRSYLLQEKLVGAEFAVDTFSWQGQHHLIHVRQYEKEYFNGAPIPRMTRTFSSTDPVAQAITAFMFKVLDTIEMHNGFCHTEIFKTADGFFVIDINPRLPGANHSSCALAKETYGFSHADVLSHVLLKQPMDKTYCPGQVLYLQNLKPRVIGKVQVDKINHLPSFRRCISNKPEGIFLSLPREMWDTVAFVVLAHHDSQQLEKDRAFIFALEQQGALF